MIIDIFPHIFTEKYARLLQQKLLPGPGASALRDFITENIEMSQIDVRFRIMDKTPQVVQVLN
jgi:hypothetical protein